MTVAGVYLWGRQIGAVSRNDQPYAAFQYDPNFLRSGIQVAPLKMPLSIEIYTFPTLPYQSFHGLPGLLADCLPDKFGNAVIDAWLATQGRTPETFDAVERLTYIGSRGMGALEFRPSIGPRPTRAQKIHVDALVQLASEILTNRNRLQVSFADPKREASLNEILKIGTSAGGARAKAIIAWNPKTDEVRSGQSNAGPGFGYWLLKFDGVSGNKDKDALDDPMGFGAVEYAYYKMATTAGIKMTECRLLEENGRRHFMTRRFDRPGGGEKLHMQSLAALAHLDFNNAGAHSYEEAIMVIKQLQLPMAAIEEQYRRAAFNVVARNQDDHVKNIAFLMDKEGSWSLSPAFDVSYAYNPSGPWTSQHQMSLNGKRNGFSVSDFEAFAKTAGMKRGRGMEILNEVQMAVGRWTEFAEEVGVVDTLRTGITAGLRLDLPSN